MEDGAEGFLNPARKQSRQSIVVEGRRRCEGYGQLNKLATQGIELKIVSSVLGANW